MAAPTYVAAGAVTAVTTSAAVAYPAGLAAGDILVMFVSSDVSAIPTDQSAGGWTALGAVVTGGGLSTMTWWKTASGSETGTHNITGITAGSKGVGWMKAYRPTTSGNALVPTVVTAIDADTSSTAFSATAGALPVQVDDWLAADWVMLAPSGSYSGNATGVAMSETGATMTTTARFGARSGSNTITYGSIDGAVTAITAPTVPTVTASGTGANAAGQARVIRIHEVAAAAASPQPVTGVIGAATYGSPATILAGMSDASDATGVAMSGTVGDVMTLLCDEKLPAGIVSVAFRALGNGGTASISARLYARDDTTPVGPAKTYGLFASASDFTYTLTAGESSALTDRQGLRLKITQTA